MKNSFRIGLTIILIILFSYGCFRKENYNIRMTITPDQIIESYAQGDLEDASSIIRHRMNAFGIEDENINLEVSADKIIMSLTGLDTGKVETIKEIITATVDIGFWETYDNSEVITFLVNANSKSRELNLGEEFRPYRKTAADSADKDELLLQMIDSSSITAREEFNLENPMFAILYPMVSADGTPMPSCLIGLSDIEDTVKVMQLLSRDEIRNFFPRDLKFMWSRDPYKYDESGRLYELHALKIATYNGRPVLDGEEIPEAEAISDRSGTNIRLRLILTHEGAAKWSAVTSDNINRSIAVSLNGKIITYPRVMNEITGGSTEISGNFSLPEAQYLAAVLSSGGIQMPFKLKISELKLEKGE